MYAGDDEVLRRLFDARAPVVGTAMGNHLAMSLDTFIERSVASRRTHGEAASRIEGMQIVGDTAQATVGGRYRELWFTDTLMMVRRPEGWLIDAKTFFTDGPSPERDAGPAEDGDVAAVAAKGEAYYRAMFEGDETALKRLFTYDAPIVGTMDGDFIWDSRDAFIEETKSLVGQHGEATSRIDALQVRGDTALVTVGGRYWKRWFTDQLAMVRGDDGWMIHAKSFHAHPAEQD
tara:strand:- start:923 stop:1621 length:699 start_codon:yes stop_codon:yes gene_type:complete